MTSARIGDVATARSGPGGDAPRRRRPIRAGVAALCLAFMALALAAAAGASQRVHLFAGFSPNRARVSTTITFGFTISSPAGQVPSPLRAVDLHLPAGIGLARNTLGTAVCEPADLYVKGPQGCPPDSHLGYGTALAEVPYGPEVVQERAAVFAYRGNSDDEHVLVLFFAEGWSPVFADLVFPAQLLEDAPPFSARLNTEVPPVPSLPGGPNVSIVQFQSTFGPKNLIYEREINGELVFFHPRGVTLPSVCPPGGYPFAGDFSFEDGTHQTAHAGAPCPAGARSRPRRRRG